MVKRLFLKIPYPKLILLLFSFYLARLILTDDNNFYFHATIDRFGYWSVALAGFFIGFGFTFAPAVAVLFVAAKNLDFLAAGSLASLAAFLGNYTIFRLVRVSFEKEITALAERKYFSLALGWINQRLPGWARRYLLPVFAGILVATPLPDELAVAIIAACKKISFPVFSVVSFIFAGFGIFMIIALGNIIK